MPSRPSAAPGKLARAVAAELRVEMARARLSGAAVARQSGLSQNYVAKRLRDELPFSLNDLEAISAALGVSYVTLFDRAASSLAD